MIKSGTVIHDSSRWLTAIMDKTHPTIRIRDNREGMWFLWAQRIVPLLNPFGDLPHCLCIYGGHKVSLSNHWEPPGIAAGSTIHFEGHLRWFNEPYEQSVLARSLHHTALVRVLFSQRSIFWWYHTAGCCVLPSLKHISKNHGFQLIVFQRKTVSLACIHELYEIWANWEIHIRHSER